jgi:toxin YoeB
VADLMMGERFVADLRHWAQAQPRLVGKVLDLVEAVRRDPYTGIGKPEPLKHLGSGLWSRRITDEHRLVYRVEGSVVTLLTARGHYE